MREERIRELEWAATACRGSVGWTKENDQHWDKITPEVILELIKALRTENLEPEMAAAVKRFKDGVTTSAEIRLCHGGLGGNYATIYEKFLAGHTLGQEFRVL